MKRASLRHWSARNRGCLCVRGISGLKLTTIIATAFAALDYLSGKIFAHTAAQYTHRQWLDFLRKIDREVPSELEIHVICDNYATHKHPKVISWLKRHRRFHLHFTPTSSSWLNLVERFFGELTCKVVRPGSFRNVGELVDGILRFLEQRNQNATPYRWTADPENVLAKNRWGMGSLPGSSI